MIPLLKCLLKHSSPALPMCRVNGWTFIQNNSANSVRHSQCEFVFTGGYTKQLTSLIPLSTVALSILQSHRISVHTVKHWCWRSMINILNGNTDYYHSITVVASSQKKTNKKKKNKVISFIAASSINLIPLLIRFIIKPRSGHYAKCCLWYNKYNSMAHLGTGYDIMRSSGRLKH